jgi:hypothetical protein
MTGKVETEEGEIQGKKGNMAKSSSQNPVADIFSDVPLQFISVPDKNVPVTTVPVGNDENGE